MGHWSRYLFLHHFLNKLESSDAGFPGMRVDDSLRATGHSLVHNVFPLHGARLSVTQHQHQSGQLLWPRQRLVRGLFSSHVAPPVASPLSLLPVASIEANSLTLT